MGGAGGVRGYTDGEAYGDSGWRISMEPQSPPINIGSFGNEGHIEPCWLHASAFLDYGEIFLADRAAAAGLERRNFLGAGTALSVNVGIHIDARLTVAWPLLTD